MKGAFFDMVYLSYIYQAFGACYMKRLQEYMNYLGWSITDLARKSEISLVTARRAVRGKAIRPFVAQKIAKALTSALGTPVMPGDLEDLKIER
jgi:transcriptional regulator with XRE-family HTH domain